jgi:hypothetical protein
MIQETSYYVHSLHVSERGAYQVAKAAEAIREEQHRRGIDGRAKRSKSTQRYRYQTEGSVTNRSDS